MGRRARLRRQRARSPAQREYRPFHPDWRRRKEWGGRRGPVRNAREAEGFRPGEDARHHLDARGPGGGEKHGASVRDPCLRWLQGEVVEAPKHKKKLFFMILPGTIYSHHQHTYYAIKYKCS